MTRITRDCIIFRKMRIEKYLFPRETNYFKTFGLCKVPKIRLDLWINSFTSWVCFLLQDCKDNNR